MRRARSFGLWFVLLWLALWLVAAVFVYPVAAVWGSCWLIYRLYRFYHNLPGVRARRDHRKAVSLYRRASAHEAVSALPGPEQFALQVNDQLTKGGPAPAAAAGFTIAARTLYEDEEFVLKPPGPASGTSALDAARYRDAVATWIAKVSNADAIDIARETVVRSFGNISKLLAPLVRDLPHEEVGGSGVSQAEQQLAVRFMDVLTDIPQAVEILIQPYFSQKVISAGLFTALRDQLEVNAVDMSGASRTMPGHTPSKTVAPTQHKGSHDEIVHGYLRQTPLEALFYAKLPFQIPEAARYEHQWIVAGSGHGKTQTLQFQIGSDLRLVAAGRASVIVIDSQGDMIKTIAGLKLFAEGQPLHGKLCLIDPTDIEYPVALNLFDAGIDRMAQYGELERERLMNGVLELYDFVLGSLLSAELTQKQGVIFRYITRLMLHIPGATIHTFRELMGPKGYDRYLPHIAKLEGTARAFFETEFNSKQFEDTKRQVIRRLWGILENRTFERMFSHPRNKLNLFAEMNSGKVILINCAKELLKQNGTEIFGRFFIALIAQAAQERATLPKDKRMPTYVYLDEAGDYLDHNVALILEQARKFNVAMILAQQYLGQNSPKLLDSLSANTSIKFAGGVSDKDARAFSHMLRCTPEFIESQPKGYFAASIRNFTPSAVSLRIPFGRLERMPRMTAAELSRVRAAMRAQYAEPWLATQEATDKYRSGPGDVSSADEPFDTNPASEW